MKTDQDWYGPESATFGDRVAAARETAGMSQDQLAKRLGVKRTTLQSWEDDRSEPRANRLSIMAGLLNVSMMWLMNGQGEGLGMPADDDSEPGDMRSVLVEIRAMQAKIHAAAEDLGRLEKKLRKSLKETA